MGKSPLALAHPTLSGKRVESAPFQHEQVKDQEEDFFPRTRYLDQRGNTLAGG